MVQTVQTITCLVKTVYYKPYENGISNRLRNESFQMILDAWDSSLGFEGAEQS